MQLSKLVYVQMTDAMSEDEKAEFDMCLAEVEHIQLEFCKRLDSLDDKYKGMVTAAMTINSLQKQETLKQVGAMQ